MQLKIFFTLLVVGLLNVQAKQVVEAEHLNNNAVREKSGGILAKDLVTIGDNQYYISPNTTLINALEALELCNDVGMTLLNLETEEKYELVTDYLHTNGLGAVFYWTGAVELVNVWFWTGLGRSVEYFKWEAGNPDLSNSYACLAVKGSLGMNDVACTSLIGFICEFPC